VEDYILLGIVLFVALLAIVFGPRPEKTSRYDEDPQFNSSHHGYNDEGAASSGTPDHDLDIME